MLLAFASLMASRVNAGPVMFGVGHARPLSELPAKGLRERLDQLPPPVRERAQTWLESFEFPANDAASLHVDPDGGVFYACEFPSLTDATPQEQTNPVVAAAAVPVSPFPSSLFFHSRPGSTNVIFLDFDGHVVTGTQWNISYTNAQFQAVPFSLDGDYTTYSDAEQAAIRSIWQRMSEDYAPFDVDVTTESPPVFHSRVARALITRNTDATGANNPAPTAGGVAYVNVFGLSTFVSTYSPAWIYVNRLGYSEANCAEAASHEIGHNMGLSHDGRTDGYEYYDGHGTDANSWGPIMGTGYGRNVSQWCKGEYYLANNTQDDLATIAAKLKYLNDDVGSNQLSAAYLTVTAGTNVLATTPETDPTNSNGANKGILERTSDVDVWSFTSGAGLVNLTARPWVSPANTRGGNVNLRLRLLNQSGEELAVNDPTNDTSATIQIGVTGGVYFLSVENFGQGDPYSSSPSGYTAYGGVGQYFITGRVVEAGAFIIPPQATLIVSNLSTTGSSSHLARVSYSDNVGLSVASLGGNDIWVEGPGGFSNYCSFVSVDSSNDGTPRLAIYHVPAPGGAWDRPDNGVYSIYQASQSVADVEGAYVPPGLMGAFTCAIPSVIYSAMMTTNSGWTLDSGWAFGKPSGTSGDPASGATGTNVIGYNLSGGYAKNLATKYATTPAISCASNSSVILRFQRWLGVANRDAAFIQISTNGSVWQVVWSNTAAVADTAWQSVQYDLSSVAANRSTVYLRWALASNGDNSTSYGWNIDDVELFSAVAATDTTPPSALLQPGNAIQAGGLSYDLSVTYADESGVQVATFSTDDILVTGPNAFSVFADFTGSSESGDGSPRTAFYRITPPGGSWDIADNGTYTVTLQADSVLDTLGNGVAEATLGTFSVALATSTQRWTLVAFSLQPERGGVTPTSNSYANGETVFLTALPAPYYTFTGWSGNLSGSANPASLLMTTNRTVFASFDAILTTNNSTPQWWLAQLGYTQDFENASLTTGANGRILWESYIAGLDPANPTSDFRAVNATFADNGVVLQWSPQSGRVYSILATADLAQGPQTLPGADALPWPIQSYTTAPASGLQIYQLRAQKP